MDKISTENQGTTERDNATSVRRGIGFELNKERFSKRISEGVISKEDFDLLVKYVGMPTYGFDKYQTTPIQENKL
jgi:hypothetical protein